MARVGEGGEEFAGGAVAAGEGGVDGAGVADVVGGFAGEVEGGGDGSGEAAGGAGGIDAADLDPAIGATGEGVGAPVVDVPRL